MTDKGKGQRAKGKARRADRKISQFAYVAIGILPEYLVAVVVVLVPFHAFLTVWLSTFLGHYTLLRLWPEFALLLLSVWLFAGGQTKTIWYSFSQHRLAWPIVLYLGLTFVYFVITLFRGEVGLQAASYGLLLSTRPVVWFVLVYAVANRNGWLHEHWKPITFWPLVVISVFALLQFFVLPSDWLKHVGYVKDVTISPVQTLNQDTATIRVQSTLRGPNPLGAYLLLGLGLVWMAGFSFWKRAGLLTSSFAALLLSFSRSAWLGVVVTAASWFAAKRGIVRGRRQILVVLAGVLATLIVCLVAVQSNQGIKNAFLHVNDRSTAPRTSNEDRLSALKSGTYDVLREPLGRGPGTAGPASVYSHAAPPRNSENYFLGIGQEIGWLGLGLFLLICYRLVRQLYKTEQPFAKMLFATFLGLTFVNMLSYAWSDVTLSYLWWGLAGIVLGSNRKHA